MLLDADFPVTLISVCRVLC